MPEMLKEAGAFLAAHPWVWGAAAGVLGLLILGVVLRLRKKPAPAQPEPAGLGTPRVGKLHAQGARDSQQDSFSVSPLELLEGHGLLAAVADGMGGLSHGDQVSQTAVRAVMDRFLAAQGTAGDPEMLLLSLLEGANRAVNDLLGPEGCSRSGSTLVLGLVRGGMLSCLSVGDSRICLYRDGALYQLSREHVYRRELALRAVNGEGTLAEAWAHPQAAGLTSFLGMGALKEVDLPAKPLELRAGDTVVLMTDGVFNALEERELREALAPGGQEAADRIGRLVEQKQYAGQDNYTAVVLSF